MLILEEPYVSDLLLSWASETEHPVLKTRFTEDLSRIKLLRLIDDEQAVELVDSGDLVYTNSENALEWILENASNARLNDAIKLFKDKRLMRDILAPLASNLFYAAFEKQELAEVNPSELPLPVVLKPSIGFCSMGVYTIETSQDWDLAIDDIKQNESSWLKRYPESVVDTASFIVEQFVDGPEYAIDIYFDEAGKPVILNIMHHVFTGPEDTSDRLYNTSANIINETYDKLESWLTDVQRIIGVRDFPAHVEVRISDDGNVIPIEFNALRFAGLGGTDIAYYAWGIRTYAEYLERRSPNLRALASKQPDAVYTMSLLNPHPSADLSKRFDYEGLEQRFTEVLDFHKFDADSVGSYGFLFLKTDDSTAEELDWLLHSDLLEFQKD